MVKVTDKRMDAATSTDNQEPQTEDAKDSASGLEIVTVEKQDPATELINKVFKFVVDQPEFYMILQLSRPERKMLAKRIAKVITTFPHFKKVDNAPEEG